MIRAIRGRSLRQRNVQALGSGLAAVGDPWFAKKISPLTQACTALAELDAPRWSGTPEQIVFDGP